MRDWWARMNGRWSSLLELYGKVALGTYVAIFVLTLGGYWMAIRSGVDVGTSVGEAGTFGAAYLATKISQPLRIGATLVLTPIVAHLVGVEAAPEAPSTES